MIVYTDKHRVPFLIDEEDALSVSRYTWRIGSVGYPTTSVGKHPSTYPVPLHIFLMGRAPTGLNWDHINRDKLDNRRANLRPVTPSVNVLNRSLLPNNRSGYNGVSWHSQHGKWEARICVNGRRHFLGFFAVIEDATRARAEAEKELGVAS